MGQHLLALAIFDRNPRKLIKLGLLLSTLMLLPYRQPEISPYIVL